MLGVFKSLWRFRNFILSSIVQEFRIKFSRSRIGALWLILQPLSQVLIYALILSTVLAAKLPGTNTRYGYALYLMSGTLAWSLFNEIVTGCLTVFVQRASLIKKMQFPRMALPAVVVGTALINNLMLFIAMLLIFAVFGHFPSEQIVYLPFLTLITVALALGIGLILGLINVFIRDLGYAVPILLQLLFWATPVVYPLSIIPERLKPILSLNPLLPVVNSYQQILLYAKAPDISESLTMIVCAVTFLGLGLFVFRRASNEMVDVL